MEKVLNLLNDIEEKASAIIDHTSIEKKSLYKEMTKEMNEFDEAVSKDTQKKLDVIRDEMELEINASKKELLSSFEIQIKQLEEDYTKNHDNYVETVFQKIIKE